MRGAIGDADGQLKTIVLTEYIIKVCSRFTVIHSASARQKQKHRDTLCMLITEASRTVSDRHYKGKVFFDVCRFLVMTSYVARLQVKSNKYWAYRLQTKTFSFHAQRRRGKMKKTVKRFPLTVGMLISVTVLASLLSSSFAEENYPITISVITSVSQDEERAHRTYIAYSRKAAEDNYPGIARLFVALATSESIHAANFRKILSDLVVAVQKMEDTTIQVGSTKANLKKSTQVELDEIDKKYPGIIEKIKPENHEEAMRFITYAWQSEKQHRDLIKQIKSGTGIFFNLLARNIEDTDADFVVCENCGSTLMELPLESCPICGKPVANYKKIESIE
jgi:rubrerythrin